MLQGALLGLLPRRRRAGGWSASWTWAELQEFIDAPMRTFSTGMAARLAFAVATDVDPDILLVDEALASATRSSSASATTGWQALTARGKTFMLVSHSLEHDPQELQPRRSGCTTGAWSATATPKR